MNQTHGFAKKGHVHPVYRSWTSMRYRCLTKTSDSYKNYGGRGIKICNAWTKFQAFYDDMFSSWIPGLSLDRIDVDGDYTPENCRWATLSIQNKNKRNKADKQSQYEGVVWDKRTNSWAIDVKKRGYNTPEEANTVAQQVLELLR